MNNMNKRFGRVLNHEIRYAKNYIILPNGSVIINPSDQQYLDANQFKVIDEMPVKEGYYYTHKDWVEDIALKTATHIYEEHKIEPEKKIRHFSKLKLYVALTQLGISDEQFMNWLSTKEVEVDGVKIRGDIAFNKAQDMTDNHPMFQSIAKDAQKTFGLDDKQLEKILDTIEYNPMEEL